MVLAATTDSLQRVVLQSGARPGRGLAHLDLPTLLSGGA